jgi:hypothetical protein
VDGAARFQFVIYKTRPAESSCRACLAWMAV